MVQPVTARAQGEGKSYLKIKIGKALAFTRAMSSSEVKEAELLTIFVWELVSSSLLQKRQFETAMFRTSPSCLLRKSCPVSALMAWPIWVLFIFRIFSDLLRSSLRKNILVCLASLPFCPLFSHMPRIWFVTSDLATFLAFFYGMGGPFPNPMAPSLASMSACSLPSWSLCASIQFTWRSWFSHHVFMVSFFSLFGTSSD